MIPAIPTLLPMPFAQNGERRDILENNTIPGSADASWATGFPPVTRINKQAGGKPPYGLDFQGIFYVLSQHLFFLQSGGVYPWQGANGDFPGLDYLAGAHVLGSNGQEYIALNPSGPNVPKGSGGFVGPVDPVTDATNEYWRNATPKTDAAGLCRGGIAAYYNVTFGGSDGRRPIFWGETEADENYVLCDGGSDGAGGIVPDLRGRMIMGASDARPAGSIGGAKTHKHSLSGTVGATTLTVNQSAVHRHDIRSNGNRSQPGNFPLKNDQYNSNWGNSWCSDVGGSQPHTHSLTASTEATGSLPPYYALAYIMRIA